MVAGIPYWQLPYANIALPNSLIGVGTVVIIIIAVIMQRYGKLSGKETLFACGAAYPAVVLVRIIFETAVVSNTHNLWPIELVISAILGAVVGGVASVIGRVLRAMI